MEEFRNVLQDCNLSDLGFAGLPYTYDNGQYGVANVRVRLDRVVANPEWSNLFSDAKVQHVVLSRSDHYPLLIELRKDKWNRRGPKLFRYDVMWEREDSLPEVIKREWCNLPNRGSLTTLVQVLENMQSTLRRWSKQHFSSVTDELNKLRMELETIQGRPIVNNDECRAIKDQMDELLYQEEMMWLQRSRVSWLKEGDQNTKYFHQQSKWRAQKNKIKKLKEDGSWCDNPRELQNMAQQYFADLYSMDSRVSPDVVLNLIETKVTQEMNEALCREFSEKEISDAMF
jgi:hypothetical protein